MRRLWSFFASPRATLIILLLLAALLLGNVILPQQALGDASYRQLVERSAAARFFLVTLRFGDMPRSPIFLGMLGLFFLNLLFVLANRLPQTVRRIRFRPPTVEKLRAWQERGEALVVDRPATWDGQGAEALLRGLRYRTARPDGSSLWGLKYRAAAAGFVIFHSSFLVLGIGGVLLYYTRFVATIALAEGQDFNGDYSQVSRRPPLGPPSAPAFRLERVEPFLQDGKPLQLHATLRRGTETETVRINHPAEWGPISILVEGAGLAPVFWLQDARGFTRDRVVLLAGPARGGGWPTVPLVGGAVEASVEPILLGPRFPDRAQLGSTAIRVKVRRDGIQAFEGDLRPGQIVHLGTDYLQLLELRYWARLRLVSERGGAVLVAGFVIAVLGLLWRMLWYRREVAVIWDEQHIFLLGRSEYFPRQFKEELDVLRELLAAGPESSGAPPASTDEHAP